MYLTSWSIYLSTTLIAEGSRMKRANMLMFSTEWKACKMEQGENGCLYTRSIFFSSPSQNRAKKALWPTWSVHRLPNVGKIEGNGVSYCISIGPQDSEDSTCCVPKVRRLKISTKIIIMSGSLNQGDKYHEVQPEHLDFFQYQIHSYGKLKICVTVQSLLAI